MASATETPKRPLSWEVSAPSGLWKPSQSPHCCQTQQFSLRRGIVVFGTPKYQPPSPNLGHCVLFARHLPEQVHRTWWMFTTSDLGARWVSLAPFWPLLGQNLGKTWALNQSPADTSRDFGARIGLFVSAFTVHPVQLSGIIAHHGLKRPRNSISVFSPVFSPRWEQENFQVPSHLPEPINHELRKQEVIPSKPFGRRKLGTENPLLTSHQQPADSAEMWPRRPIWARNWEPFRPR